MITFRCNMPKAQSRAALKQAALLTVCLTLCWLLIGTALLAQMQHDQPTVREVEQKLNQHLLEANVDFQKQRIARLEIAVAANSDQLDDYRAYGGAMFLLLAGMNALGLVGWKVNLVRSTKDRSQGG